MMEDQQTSSEGRPSFTTFWRKKQDDTTTRQLTFVDSGPLQSNNNKVSDQTDESEQSAKNKRRAQVRKAQIQHRQRKANYVKQLESDIAGIREQIEDAERERRSLRGENQAIRARLSSPSSSSTATSAGLSSFGGGGGNQAFHYDTDFASIPTSAYLGMLEDQHNISSSSSAHHHHHHQHHQHHHHHGHSHIDVDVDFGPSSLNLDYFPMSDSGLNSNNNNDTILPVTYYSPDSSSAAYASSSSPMASSTMYESPQFLESSGRNTPYRTLPDMMTTTRDRSHPPPPSLQQHMSYNIFP